MDDNQDISSRPIRIIDGVGGPMVVSDTLQQDQDDLEDAVYDDPRQILTIEEDL
jgi:hypothetical protein